MAGVETAETVEMAHLMAGMNNSTLLQQMKQKVMGS